MRVFELRLGDFARMAALALPLALAAPAALAQGPEPVAALAAGLSGAVVNIATSHMISDGGQPFPDLPEGSPLQDLFDNGNPNNGEGEHAMREARSLGSGFIVDKSGLIVTNNHVIEDADEIFVYTQDNERFEATLVGTDDKTDLAVLKVEAKHDLPFVTFGDSDSAEVGDWVMAIGNPFGLGGSVTLGIVSARNRNINSGPYDAYIQTDAAINQGNSGGPLFDMDGHVVGINTAIISRTGGGLGIGFAIPSNLASPVVRQLEQFGETRRGWLGVGIQDVTLDMAESLGRNDTHGAMVVDVTQGGPSEGTIKEGDVILDFNGRPIVQMRDLPRFVAETAVGTKVMVHVLRNGAETDVDVTLGRLENNNVVVADAAPKDPGLKDVPDATTPAGLIDIVGFNVIQLDAASRDEFGFEADVDGVAISDVKSGTDADEKGLTPGLVVAEVNQQPISDVAGVEALVNAAREAGRPAVLLKVIDHQGGSHFLAVKLN